MRWLASVVRMTPPRRILVENADWLAVASLVLWFATVALAISGLVYGHFPDAWTVAAVVSFVIGLASGSFARTVLKAEDRAIATAALGMYVGVSALAVFITLVFSLGFEGS